MKFKTNFFKVIFYCFFTISNSLSMFAQGGPDPPPDPWDDGPDPPPGASIDDYVYLMIFVAFIIMFYFFYNKEFKTEKTSKIK